MTTFQLAPKWPKVAVSGFCKFGSFQPNLTLRQLDWSTMMFIESPFIWYPTCLIFALVVWWSMTSCTARKTSRRRPGRRLTLGYITSVDVFFIGCDRLWWCWMIWEFFINTPYLEWVLAQICFRLMLSLQNKLFNNFTFDIIRVVNNEICSCIIYLKSYC